MRAVQYAAEVWPGAAVGRRPTARLQAIRAAMTSRLQLNPTWMPAMRPRLTFSFMSLTLRVERQKTVNAHAGQRAHRRPTTMSPRGFRGGHAAVKQGRYRFGRRSGAVDTRLSDHREGGA